MNWDQITLGQFQDIHRLCNDKSLDDLERAERAISILYNLTETQVENLSLLRFNEYSREVSKFLNQADIPGKPVKSFRVGLKKYALHYRPSELKHRQYVEILAFSEKPIENMHLILASLVRPVKWGFIRQDNKAEDHIKVSDDMQKAPLLAVYHSCVFFCKLYKNLTLRIRDYLIKEMMSKGATREQAESLVTNSINFMDGFIQPGKLQSLEVSH